MISSLEFVAVPTARMVLGRGKNIIGASSQLIRSCNIHTTSKCDKYQPWKGFRLGTPRWFNKNTEVFPPQQTNEERRPAWVCHGKENIKFSPLKMWYSACLIRGMSIDEALKQISFVNSKGAAIIKETLLEAQELAVNEHNVEYKSNLWVAESNVSNGGYVQGYRRHARARFGSVHYQYCHYMVRLVEGKPPKYFYKPELTADGMLKAYLDKLRQRKIYSSL